MHIFIAGDPVDGFTFIGPVLLDDTRLENEYDHMPWWYVELTSREDEVGETYEEDQVLTDLTALIHEAYELFDDDLDLAPVDQLRALELLRMIVRKYDQLPEADD
jgi:hypothetical protein